MTQVSLCTKQTHRLRKQTYSYRKGWNRGGGRKDKLEIKKNFSSVFMVVGGGMSDFSFILL